MLNYTGIVPDSARLVIIAASAVVFGLGALALAVAGYFRRSPAIRSIQLPLLALVHLGSMLWWAGFLYAHGIVLPASSSIMCSVSLVWILFVFGAMLHLNMLIMRLYALRKALVRQNMTGGSYAIISLMLYAPTIAFGVLATFMPELGVGYDPANHQCRSSLIYAGVALTLVLVSLGTFGVSVLRIVNDTLTDGGGKRRTRIY